MQQASLFNLATRGKSVLLLFSENSNATLKLQQIKTLQVFENFRAFSKFGT